MSWQTSHVGKTKYNYKITVIKGFFQESWEVVYMKVGKLTSLVS